MLEALIGHNQAQVMTYNIIESKGASPHSCLVLRWYWNDGTWRWTRKVL